MTEAQFLKLKKDLREVLLKRLSVANSGNSEILNDAVRILDNYKFSDRDKNKGRLTRFALDCLDVEYAISEKIIQFDNAI